MVQVKMQVEVKVKAAMVQVRWTNMGNEYAEGIRIERGRERSRAAAAAAASRQEIKGI
jgi:hypothetical protein